ncbi:uncharacterized protein LOC129600763 isoform X2 [Paramacrobiotus metropolitanus]|uniref:uncharacterized protein LOC129600763 isoform X2 n=1 Tax=Paramacrobiotus metropolitanus TaxID=2943436 RepID=UPI002446175C|nr:uncharacterized protein LOC129600763 isoform X2 [Paramacrobiotus metropolitanus]
MSAPSGRCRAARFKRETGLLCLPAVILPWFVILGLARHCEAGCSPSPQVEWKCEVCGTPSTAACSDGGAISSMMMKGNCDLGAGCLTRYFDRAGDGNWVLEKGCGRALNETSTTPPGLWPSASVCDPYYSVLLIFRSMAPPSGITAATKYRPVNTAATAKMRILLIGDRVHTHAICKDYTVISSNWPPTRCIRINQLENGLVLSRVPRQPQRRRQLQQPPQRPHQPLRRQQRHRPRQQPPRLRQRPRPLRRQQRHRPRQQPPRQRQRPRQRPRPLRRQQRHRPRQQPPRQRQRPRQRPRPLRRQQRHRPRQQPPRLRQRPHPPRRQQRHLPRQQRPRPLQQPLPRLQRPLRPQRPRGHSRPLRQPRLYISDNQRHQCRKPRKQHPVRWSSGFLINLLLRLMTTG